jgi:hypothetical protein
MTSEKFQVRRLKTSSYEVGVSELHTWLTDSILVSPKDGQEERVEERPQHGGSLKLQQGRDTE